MRQPPAVILVRPTEEGNVGATARAMANMGLERLLLVEPAVELEDTAYAFAVGARDILAGAERYRSLAAALAPFQRAVGTTSDRARALDAELLTPGELAPYLERDPHSTRTALVFGPERSGLTTDELAHLDPLVTIPCSRRQPTLNLAQAVLLVAWELRRAALPAATREERPEAAAIADVEGLFDQLEPLLGRIGFARDDTFAGVLRDLRQLAARAAPSAREVSILRGLCRRAGYALDHPDSVAAGDKLSGLHEEE